MFGLANSASRTSLPKKMAATPCDGHRNRRSRPCMAASSNSSRRPRLGFASCREHTGIRLITLKFGFFNHSSNDSSGLERNAGHQHFKMHFIFEFSIIFRTPLILPQARPEILGQLAEVARACFMLIHRPRKKEDLDVVAWYFHFFGSMGLILHILPVRVYVPLLASAGVVGCENMTQG